MKVTVFELFWPSFKDQKEKPFTGYNLSQSFKCALWSHSTVAVQCIHRAEIREHCWWCAGAGQEEASEPASAQRGADLDKAQTGVQNQPGPAQRWQLGSHQAHHQICTAHLL